MTSHPTEPHSTMSTSLDVDGDAVAAYLAAHPAFFDEHAELLSGLRLASSVSGRAISLQERQMEVLRDKIKTLELKLAGLLRIGRENDSIAERFHEWTCSLLATKSEQSLPQILIDGLRERFDVPQATLRLWGVKDEYAHAWFAAGVSDDVRIFSNGLDTPFCGPNKEFEAALWLPDPAAVRSIAMLPLRAASGEPAFGLLVLGSDELGRFSEDMSTDFLSRFAGTAGAALACLRT
ncbi:DUF484 family protein [Noviherbaspirillum pedocola]|nr:DUF484 family protein [Noviherbaspirillum pedocola]